MGACEVACIWYYIHIETTKTYLETTMNNDASNICSNSMAKLEDIVQNYVELNCALVSVGWGLWGDSTEDFSNDPLGRCYGAQKFYREEGRLRCVSVSLNIRDNYGMANIVIIKDIAIETVADEKEQASTVFALDKISSSDVASIINKYKQHKALEVLVRDFEDECEYFMSHTSDGRVIFQNRSDENRQKPDHETNRYHKLMHCDYEVYDKDDSYGMN